MLIHLDPTLVNYFRFQNNLLIRERSISKYESCRAQPFDTFHLLTLSCCQKIKCSL